MHLRTLGDNPFPFKKWKASARDFMVIMYKFLPLVCNP